jgi:hypothetical protein
VSFLSSRRQSPSKFLKHGITRHAIAQGRHGPPLRIARRGGERCDFHAANSPLARTCFVLLAEI